MTPTIHAAITVRSPDEKVQVSVSRNAARRLVHAVQFNGQPALVPSPIGVTIDAVDFGAGVELGRATIDPLEIEFDWRGNHARVRLRGTAAMIPLKQKDAPDWKLEIRCFDTGVAYRCMIPGAGSRKVSGEAVAWNVPEGTRAWCNPDTTNYEGMHERHTVNAIPAETFKNGIGMPVTLELPGGVYAAITEADVTGYSGMTLERTGSWQLKSSFRDDPDGWTMSGEIRTPWRVLMLAENLNTLVNADIVPALCPPPDKTLFPDGIHTRWLKPGRCLWQWWAYDDAGTHWSRQKWFIDRAAELNCQYYLVDEGWEHTRQEWATGGIDAWTRMKELCDYASGKGIGIWVWRGWRYDEKRQWPGLETAGKREEFFRRCADAGVKGAKIDFMDSESHDILAFYEDCTRAAARHRVMVNFHGANKPAGEARTWPNEMTREGLRGLEYNKWSTLPPAHYATLPFTRLLAGHADFTPTTLQPDRLKGTTVAQQLACSVVLTSPMLCWADKPDLYLASPAVDLIRSVPVTWDETIVLPPSAIGDLAAIARRSGDAWYVGVLNGASAREVDVRFSFLGSGEYRADFYGDTPGRPATFDVQRDVALTAETTRTIKLSDGGGLAVWIRPR